MMDVYFLSLHPILTLLLYPDWVVPVKLRGVDVIRRNDSVFLNCSSDNAPIGFMAHILVNHRSFTSIRLYKNKCYASINDSQCNPNVCMCSTSGRWYSYSYKALNTEDTVRITCSMDFHNGPLSDSIVIKIYGFTGPKISIDQELPISPGLSLQLTCTAETKFHHIILSWDCFSSGQINKKVNSTKYLSTLKSVVQMSDNNANCTCYAKVDRLTSTQSIILKINPKPVLLLENKKTCNINHPVAISCSILGELPEDGFYQWIHSLNGKVIRMLKGVEVGNYSQLNLKRCTYEDQGNYTCRAWNRHSDIIYNVSKHTALQIYGPPVFHSTNILRQQKLILTAKFFSCPLYNTVRWYFSSDLVNATEFDQSVVMVHMNGVFYDKIIPISGFEVRLLTEASIKGKFEVIVANNHGETRKSFILKQDKGHSFSLKSLVFVIVGIGIFIMSVIVTVVVVKSRTPSGIVHVVTSTEVSATAPIVPLHHHDEGHTYDTTNPNYSELVAYQSQRTYTDIKSDDPVESNATLQPTTSDYEEIE